MINADGSKGCGGVYYMPPQHPVVGVFCLNLCQYKFTTEIIKNTLLVILRSIVPVKLRLSPLVRK